MHSTLKVDPSTNSTAHTSGHPVERALKGNRQREQRAVCSTSAATRLHGSCKEFWKGRSGTKAIDSEVRAPGIEAQLKIEA